MSTDDSDRFGPIHRQSLHRGSVTDGRDHSAAEVPVVGDGYSIWRQVGRDLAFLAKVVGALALLGLVILLLLMIVYPFHPNMALT